MTTALSETQPTPGERKATTFSPILNASETLRGQTLTDLLFMHAPLGLMIVQLFGVQSLPNPAFCRMVGYTLAELEQMSLFDLISPEFRQAYLDKRQRMLSGEFENFNDNKVLVRKDGSTLLTHSKVSVARGANGEPQYILASFEDITKDFEKEAWRRMLETSVEQLNDMVLVTRVAGDGSLRLIFVNDAFTRITGYSSAEVLGKSPRMLQGPETDRTEVARISAALRADVPVQAELLNYTKSGKSYWIEINITPIPNEYGTITHYVAIERDITPRKALELELKRLNSDLEERVHQRTKQLEGSVKDLRAFAYSLSHDLRTPLNTVSGFVALLEKAIQPMATEKTTHYVHRIKAGAMEMANLISGMLQMSKHSAEKLRPELVDLSAAAEGYFKKIIESDSGLESGSGVPKAAVSYTIQAGLMVTADRLAIMMVLQNLLDNAVKFSAKKCSPEISLTASSNAHGQLVFEVRDNGVGFDMEYASRLFQPFERLHLPSEFPGSGIGLSTVHNIITKHGGKVWAQSEPGQFASFFFTIGAVDTGGLTAAVQTNG